MNAQYISDEIYDDIELSDSNEFEFFDDFVDDFCKKHKAFTKAEKLEDTVLYTFSDNSVFEFSSECGALASFRDIHERNHQEYLMSRHFCDE